MINEKFHLLSTLYVPVIMGSANSALFHFILKTTPWHEFHCIHLTDVEPEACVVK